MRFSLGGKGDHRSYGGCLVRGVVSIATVVTLLEVLMNRSIVVKVLGAAVT
jgi:TM2 domain-containing membrane protein YozV